MGRLETKGSEEGEPVCMSTSVGIFVFQVRVHQKHPHQKMHSAAMWTG